MTRAPYSFNFDKMEIASAAPSVGSVPAQSSSKSTRERSLTWLKMRVMFVMWEENVLKDCSILCSSPMSANTSCLFVSTSSSCRAPGYSLHSMFCTPASFRLWMARRTPLPCSPTGSASPAKNSSGRPLGIFARKAGSCRRRIPLNML